MNKVAEVLEMPEIRVYEVATFYTMFNRSPMGKYHLMVCGTTPCMLQGAKGIYQAIQKHLGISYGQTTEVCGWEKGWGNMGCFFFFVASTTLYHLIYPCVLHRCCLYFAQLPSHNIPHIRPHIPHIPPHIPQDGMFTLSEMECMGACVNAPMITVADYTNGVEGFRYDYYEDLTPEDTIKIIEALRNGDQPKVGSQYRADAEAAGAVVNGKWVPKKPTNAVLQGFPPGPFCRDLDAVPAEAAATDKK